MRGANCNDKRSESPDCVGLRDSFHTYLVLSELHCDWQQAVHEWCTAIPSLETSRNSVLLQVPEIKRALRACACACPTFLLPNCPAPAQRWVLPSSDLSLPDTHTHTHAYIAQSAATPITRPICVCWELQRKPGFNQTSIERCIVVQPWSCFASTELGISVKSTILTRRKPHPVCALSCQPLHWLLLYIIPLHARLNSWEREGVECTSLQTPTPSASRRRILQAATLRVAYISILAPPWYLKRWCACGNPFRRCRRLDGCCVPSAHVTRPVHAARRQMPEKPPFQRFQRSR